MTGPPSATIGVAIAVIVLAVASQACGSESSERQGCAETAAGKVASPGPAAASGEPDQLGTIAFVNPSEPHNSSALYVINADGSGLRKLAENRGENRMPFQWSPDGRKIAFLRGRELANEVAVWVMNADGSDQRKITVSDGSWGDLDWSPNGAMIAVERVEDFDLSDDIEVPADIWVVNADGTGLRNVTQSDAHEVAPRWSPDGHKIAFERGRDEYAPADVWVMKADGSGQRKTTQNGRGSTGHAWSPNSKQLAFLRTSRKTRLIVANTDTNAECNLTRALPRSVTEAQWSPSGAEIVFVAGGRLDRRELYVVAVNGTGLRRLTRNREQELGVSWSPDGTKIAYMNGYAIHTIRPNGTDKRQLTHGAWDYFPQWSPDARHIGFSRGRYAGEPGHIWVVTVDGRGALNLSRDFPFIYEWAWQP